MNVLESEVFHPIAAQHALKLLQMFEELQLPPCAAVAAGVDGGVCLQWPEQRLWLLCWEDLLLFQSPPISLESSIDANAADYKQLVALSAEYLRG